MQARDKQEVNTSAVILRSIQIKSGIRKRHAEIFESQHGIGAGSRDRFIFVHPVIAGAMTQTRDLLGIVSDGENEALCGK